MEHKESALIPDGRILIDTEQSFVYREGGLEGVLMAARLAGLSPNLASRFTPGTLISSDETCEAVKQGIAVPFRKSDPEQVRSLSALQAADRGGMMFQPVPGTFENVEEIDFTSMYPSIIVQANLSPETVGHEERVGFLPTVLKPLLELRIRTKQAEENRPPNRRERCDSQMDACHLLRVHGLQEREVREDRGARRDHGSVQRDPDPDQGYRR